jgi:translation initiation factor IF-2
MTSIRVHEVAKRLGLSSKETVEKFLALGVPVKGHSSSVSEADVTKLAKTLNGDAKAAPAAPPKAAAAKPAAKAAPAKAAPAKAAPVKQSLLRQSRRPRRRRLRFPPPVPSPPSPQPRPSRRPLQSRQPPTRLRRPPLPLEHPAPRRTVRRRVPHDPRRVADAPTTAEARDPTVPAAGSRARDRTARVEGVRRLPHDPPSRPPRPLPHRWRLRRRWRPPPHRPTAPSTFSTE